MAIKSADKAERHWLYNSVKQSAQKVIIWNTNRTKDESVWMGKAYIHHLCLFKKSLIDLVTGSSVIMNMYITVEQNGAIDGWSLKYSMVVSGKRMLYPPKKWIFILVLKAWYLIVPFLVYLVQNNCSVQEPIHLQQCTRNNMGTQLRAKNFDKQLRHWSG